MTEEITKLVSEFYSIPSNTNARLKIELNVKQAMELLDEHPITSRHHNNIEALACGTAREIHFKGVILWINPDSVIKAYATI